MGVDLIRQISGREKWERNNDYKINKHKIYTKS